MPNKHEIRYLPIAQNDLMAIVDWIAKDSPNRAVSFVATLDKRVGALSAHPQMGRVPRNEQLRKIGYHLLIIEDFLVFYVIRGQVVEIHRVVHGSRRYEDIL
ncbi:MAG TPA: type II toxin-antitoxin system RelE/ParE family toxin [bacterium]|nr:type II toxin-antitoxin system RelE/ParE family toxin [bacterium]